MPSDTSPALRVAFYVDSPELGGSELMTRELLGALDPAIATVVIGVDAAVVDALVAKRPRSGAVVVPHVRGRHDLATIRKHARALRTAGADVVHVSQRHLWSGQYGVVAALLARIPVVGVAHAVFPSKNRSQRLLTTAVIRRADRVVGVSHFVATALERELHLAASRIAVIPNGVPDRPPAPRPTQPNLVAAIGRCAHEKGFDILIQAMAFLPTCRLALVGDGAEREALEAQARALGVDDRITFFGWHDDPWALLRPAVLAVPSRRDAAPLVVIEAMREGVPVVASRVDGIPELVVDHETGVLVDPEDPRALARGIDELIADPARAGAMGAAARRRMRSGFSVEAMARRYEALYGEVARGDTADRARWASGSFLHAGTCELVASQ